MGFAMSVMEAVTKPQAAVFSQEEEASKKGPRCCPSLGPWTTHCERSRSFARSI